MGFSFKQGNKEKIKRIFSLLFLTFLAVGGVISGLWGIKQRTEVRKKAASSPTLSFINLVPNNVSVSLQEEFPIKVTLATGERNVNNADLIINFDPQFLQVVNIIPGSGTNFPFKTFLPIDTNGNFDPSKAIKPQTVEIGATTFDYKNSQINPPFNGTLGVTNPLMTIIFKAINIGNTTLTFAFQPGATNDTNLVEAENANDILHSVNSTTVTISQETSPSPSVTPVSPSPTTPPLKKCRESCTHSKECQEGLECRKDWCSPEEHCYLACVNSKCPKDTDCICEIITPPTPTPTPLPFQPSEVKIRLNVKFAGINQKKPNQPIRIKIIKNQQLIQELGFSEVILESNQRGVYQSNLITLSPNVTPGSGYTFLVKGPKHLQLKFCQNRNQTRACSSGNITLNSGENILDFTGYPLPPGDLPLPQDGIVNSSDIIFLINCLSKPTDSGCLEKGDINLDGITNSIDLQLAQKTLLNYPEDEK